MLTKRSKSISFRFPGWPEFSRNQARHGLVRATVGRFRARFGRSSQVRAAATAQIWPKCAQFWSALGQSCSIPRELRPNLLGPTLVEIPGQLRRIRAELGRFRANSVVGFGRAWSIPSRAWSELSPACARKCKKSAQSGSCSRMCVPNTLGHLWHAHSAEFDRCQPRFERSRRMSALLGQSPTPIRPRFGDSDRLSPDLGARRPASQEHGPRPMRYLSRVA